MWIWKRGVGMWISVWRGRGGEESRENVTTFRYMGRYLDQTDDYWLSVWGNTMHVRSVWGRLGKLLRREGSEPKVLEIFYRLVVQTILLYGSETWVILAAREKTVEGIHTEFF